MLPRDRRIREDERPYCKMFVSLPEGLAHVPLRAELVSPQRQHIIWHGMVSCTGMVSCAGMVSCTGMVSCAGMYCVQILFFLYENFMYEL